MSETKVKAKRVGPDVDMTHQQIMLVVYGLMAGMFLSSLAQTVFGTAIRVIGDDLHGLDKQAWVTTAYLITSTVSMPIYGKLSDIFGRRALYIFGVSVFIAGSLLSAMSTSMMMLAGFRAFQGIGAGALMTLPLAILGDILAPRERARYQAYFMAVFGISSVLGPLVGGLLAGADSILGITGWRWVLLINLPIGAVALGMIIAFLHLPQVGHNKNTRIDWWGAATVVMALVPILLVAEQGRTWGWGSAGSIACYVIGVVGLVGFVVAQAKMGQDAIIPLKLFRSKAFSMATVLSTLVGFGMFGAMMTIPLYLQIVKGLSPTGAGFAMLPLTIGLMGASIFSGQYVARRGTYQIFPITGTISMVIGYAILLFTHDQPMWQLMCAQFFIGVGLGQLMQTLTLASQNAVEPQDMGVATSSATFFRQVGGTLGTAVLLSVLFASLGGNIGHAMEDKEQLTAGIEAALDPAVSEAPVNAAVMKQIWEPLVAQVKTQIDVNDPAARQAAADATADAVIAQLKTADGASTSEQSSDTSFLNGADSRLTHPFLDGFAHSAVAVFRIGISVIVLSLILTFFFKVPPLRARSALQEKKAALMEESLA